MRFLFFLLIFFYFLKKSLRKFGIVEILVYICKKKRGNMDLTHNIIEYVNCCVGAFANRFHLTLSQSYAYLRRFQGIDFLIECYPAEHTLSIEDAVEDMAVLCQKNGGRLSC